MDYKFYIKKDKKIDKSGEKIYIWLNWQGERSKVNIVHFPEIIKQCKELGVHTEEGAWFSLNIWGTDKKVLHYIIQNILEPYMVMELLRS
jgi:hypothetical protein